MKTLFSIIICGIGLVTLASPCSAKNTHKKKNIILIITDQQTSTAMSNMGNMDLKTPGMDQLAADGIVFESSYVSYPLSGPSRASLMTGKMPAQIGVRDNHVPNWNKDHLKTSIGMVMNEAGYDCLYAGKWHVATEEVNLPATGTGFTKVSDMDDTILVDSCIPYLKQKREKPLFLVASFLNPHEICEYARYQFLPTGNVKEPAIEDCPQLPYNASIPAYYPEAVLLNRKFDPRSYPTENYTDDDWRRYLHAYYRLIERVDHEILRLINELKKNDLYDDSVILFVSDHGDGAAAHRGNQKRTLQEEVIKVPFIVKAPGNVGKGTRKPEAIVNTSLDIYQTIIDYAGLNENPGLLGKSVRPIMEGKTNTRHEEIYVETLLDGVSTRGWAVVGKEYKYEVYRAFKNNEQLFNLKTDPYEMQNLAVDKEYQGMLKEYRNKLFEWGEKTNDKMLQNLLRHADRQ